MIPYGSEIPLRYSCAHIIYYNIMFFSLVSGIIGTITGRLVVCCGVAKEKHGVAHGPSFTNERRGASSCGLARVHGSNPCAGDWTPVRYGHGTPDLARTDFF